MSKTAVLDRPYNGCETEPTTAPEIDVRDALSTYAPLVSPWVVHSSTDAFLLPTQEEIDYGIQLLDAMANSTSESKFPAKAEVQSSEVAEDNLCVESLNAAVPAVHRGRLASGGRVVLRGVFATSLLLAADAFVSNDEVEAQTCTWSMMARTLRGNSRRERGYEMSKEQSEHEAKLICGVIPYPSNELPPESTYQPTQPTTPPPSGEDLNTLQQRDQQQHPPTETGATPAITDKCHEDYVDALRDEPRNSSVWNQTVIDDIENVLRKYCRDQKDQAADAEKCKRLDRKGTGFVDSTDESPCVKEVLKTMEAAGLDSGSSFLTRLTLNQRITPQMRNAFPSCIDESGMDLVCASNAAHDYYQSILMSQFSSFERQFKHVKK